MKNCPFCAEEIQDAAVVCKHCGRELAGGVTPVAAPPRPPQQVVVQPRGEGCFLQTMNAGCAVVGIFGLLLLGFCGYVCVKSQGELAKQREQLARATPSPSPSATPARSAAEKRATNRRIFREDHRPDDGAREFIFKSMLRKSGSRCDSIKSATMRSPGNWRVVCAPGYVYGFTFDADGEFLQAVKY